MTGNVLVTQERAKFKTSVWFYIKLSKSFTVFVQFPGYNSNAQFTNSAEVDSS